MTRKMPRLSRAKALIGTLATTVALTGVVQAAAPASALAVKASTCQNFYYLAIVWGHAGNDSLAEYFATKGWNCTFILRVEDSMLNNPNRGD